MLRLSELDVDRLGIDLVELDARGNVVFLRGNNFRFKRTRWSLYWAELGVVYMGGGC